MNHLRATTRAAKKFVKTGQQQQEAINLLKPKVCRVLSTSTDLESDTITASGPEIAVPAHSQVVICGGGIVGSSVAYHLAERGWSNVTVLEQGRLARLFISLMILIYLLYEMHHN